ncbi:MAG TPA: DUF3000 domain-containing protein [Streptosporangiaceae bacterium]|nr:DUF3000 domain-containing protein [Streptosporangiaceae bacterium]
MRRSGTLSGHGADAVFEAAVEELRCGQEQVRAARPELRFEDMPAPRTLAPFATALAVSVQTDETEVASGRFVLLYDPAGQPGWAGPLRVIVYIRADMEPEIVADPMVGQVAWSWLTEALETGTAGYAEPSGTVTRVITEGFGAKREEPPAQGFELRASWSPVLVPPAGTPQGAADAPAEQSPLGMAAHLAAWCATLCAAAGLPPLVAGVTALRPASRRRDS